MIPPTKNRGFAANYIVGTVPNDWPYNIILYQGIFNSLFNYLYTASISLNKFFSVDFPLEYP